MEIETIAKKVEGVWLPKDEKHLVDWMVNSKGSHREHGKITYQWSKQQAAMALMHAHIPDAKSKLFIDVGAHVGLWSMWWAREMQAVLAFEPVQNMASIYDYNMAFVENYELIRAALGEKAGTLSLSFNPENTGNTHKAHAGDDPATTMDVALYTLDGFFKERPSLVMPVGAMKVDCEGTEEAVLRGARATIEAYRPLIVVEQKKGAEYYGADPLGAVKFLHTLGYRTAKTMSGDHIMVPE